MPSKHLRALAVLVALGTAGLPAAARAEDWVLKAMADELARSQEKIHLEGYEGPYYLSYVVRDTERHYASAKFGALFQSDENHHRLAQVDVRVGSYDLDSSEDPESYFNVNQKFLPNNLAPIDRSETALRRVLWLLTDFKYKAALMSFLNVKAKGVNDPKARSAPSMSRETPAKLQERPAPFKFDLPAWEKGVRRVSAVLLEYPEIFDSSVEVSGVRLTRYVVTTEGTSAITVDDYYQLYVTAVTRADDGMLLQDSATWYGRLPGDMPTPAEAERETRVMVSRLVRMRDAPVLEPQTVPVLMSPEATGVFFHETIGHRLEGQRQDNEDEGRTFKGHMGQRILPEFIDIFDDPTTARAEGVSLNGFYRLDDEGVPSLRASLVEKGVLKGFLLSRKPVEGFSKSNGHGRTDGFQRPVGRMGSLFIRGSKPVPHARLKEMLLEEVRKQGKPYGLIIETIAGGATNTANYGFQAFKGIPRVAWRVDAETGKEELVRGIEIVGTPLASVGRIVATSDRYGIFNGYCGAESGSVPVSTVAPDMLFAEIELQRAQDGKERPPILPPPGIVGTGTRD